jgi:Domain of unknown function (DUF4190)
MSDEFESDEKRPRRKKPADDDYNDEDDEVRPRKRRRDDDDDRPRKRRSDSSGIENVIPFKNGYALGAYYSGIFLGLLCFFGFILGFIPLILGIVGLRKASADPEARGRVHAWIGIILGVIEILFGLLVLAGFLINLMNDPRR